MFSLVILSIENRSVDAWRLPFVQLIIIKERSVRSVRGFNTIGEVVPIPSSMKCTTHHEKHR